MEQVVASWLVRSIPDQALQVRALTGDIAMSSGKTLDSHSASLHTNV